MMLVNLMNGALRRSMHIFQMCLRKRSTRNLDLSHKLTRLFYQSDKVTLTLLPFYVCLSPLQNITLILMQIKIIVKNFTTHETYLIN